MQLTDIVNFDLKDEPGEYGFSKILILGKDAFEHTRDEKNIKPVSIIRSSSPEFIKKNMRNFDLLHLTTFEANVELITAAAAKKKRFLVPVSEILEKEGQDRSLAMYRIKRFIQFCIAYKAKFVIVSFAKSIYALRSPKEIAMIMGLVGLNENQALKAMQLWGSI